MSNVHRYISTKKGEVSGAKRFFLGTGTVGSGGEEGDFLFFSFLRGGRGRERERVGRKSVYILFCFCSVRIVGSFIAVFCFVLFCFVFVCLHK